jgi:Lysozyme like domain
VSREIGTCVNHRIGRKASFGVVATITGALALGAVAEAAGPGESAEEVMRARLALLSADASTETGDTIVLDDRQVVAQLRVLADERDEARRQAFIDALIGEVVRDLATTTTTAPPPTTAPPTTAPPTTAPPAAAPAAAPAPSGSALEAIAAWFPDVYDQAVHVASCESSLNPGAMSAGGGNHGLFQINNVHAGSFAAVTGQSWDARYNAHYNAQFARYLYDQSGWGPWACA